MNIQRLRSMLVAAALALLAALNPAQAQTLTIPNPNRVISWNYDANGTVLATDLAGLAPATNWVNTWPNNQTTGLPDNMGNVTGLGIAMYQSSGQYGASILNHHPGYDADGTANRELLNGYMNAGPAGWGPPFTNSTFTLTNIPFPVYDVVVYFSSDASGRHTAIDDGISTNYASTLGSPAVSGAGALFIPATSTNSASFPSANFVFFRRHTGSTLTVNELPKSGNDQWLGLAAWQVIESSNVYVLYGPSPASQTVPLGGAASFSVMVGGENPSVQWRLGGVPIPNATNATYTIASTALGQDGNYDVVVTNSFSSITSSVASLVFYTPKTVRWDGNGSVWDTTSPFWTINGGVSTTIYTETDNTRFDPLGILQSYITLGGTFTPSSITVSNASYTLTSGAIAGSGSLNVVNAGTLVLDTTDTSTGPVNISSDSTLQVGNGGTTGSLGSGALTNNGALLFNQSDDYAYGYPIYGSGSITNNGGSGRVTLSSDVHANYLAMSGAGSLLIQGNNSFTGGFIVNSGTVLIRSGGGLGAAPVQVNGGTLQLFFNFDFVGSSINLAGGLLDIEGGTTTFEGPISLAVDSTIQLGSRLNLTNANINGGAFNLTLTGGDTLVLPGANNTWASVTISGPTLQIGNGGPTGSLGSGTITDGGTLAFNTSGNLTVTNPITGSGAINQIGSGITTLTADNATAGFGGAINVNAGTLRINGNSGPGFVTVNTNGTLGGIGTIGADVVVNEGGTLAPGVSVGTLTIDGSLTLSGNVAVDVNKTLSPSNDLAVVSGALANTGTGVVTVNNLGPALVAGDSFKLFSQPVTGGETLSVTGAGAVWTNKLAIDGTIQVLTATIPHPRIVSSTIVGSNLVLNGTNGLANGSYQVLSSTNIATPLANWTSVASGAFGNSGQFSITNAIAPGEPQRFYLLKQP